MSEHQQLEYKQIWKDEYLKVICAFANADGGRLVVGRLDCGAVVGVAKAGKLLEDLPNKVRDVLGIMVAVNLLIEEDRELIEIQVDSYPNPVSYKGEYFYRTGSTTQSLKGAALERFLLGTRGAHWDGVPVPHVTQEDLSISSFDYFRRAASKSGRMDETILQDSNSAILENLQLQEGDYLKRAAILLFSETPERYVPGAYVKIGFFRTDAELIYQDEVHGNLFEQAHKALDLILTKYMKAYISYDGITRVERFLFPKAALREVLLNALVHRDYSTGVPIQIRVYDDQIRFWNDGELPEGWTVEKLLQKHTSKPPNPLLAGALFRTGDIESWGRGIDKIREACMEHGVDFPLFEYEPTGLSVEFRAALGIKAHDGVHDGVQDGVQDELSQLEIRILRACVQESRSSSELLEQLGFAARSRNFRNAMGRLLDGVGLLERTLPDKPKSKNQKYRLTTKGRNNLQASGEI